MTSAKHVDTQYEQLLERVLLAGVEKGDRTGVGTWSVFGERLRYDLDNGFPLITTKRVSFKAVVAELLWILRGDTNTAWLEAQGVTIWREWQDVNGDLGPIYGKQLRAWPDYDGGEIDQISALIHTLRTDPDSRRMLVSAWNVAQLDQMALAPCHAWAQFYVADGRLSCQVYQRSADLFLGLPFNIASYALLTHMIAAQTGYRPGELIWVGGDCHLYRNHLEQAHLQLDRRAEAREFATLELASHVTSLFDYTMRDIWTVGYVAHPAIPAPVAV